MPLHEEIRGKDAKILHTLEVKHSNAITWGRDGFSPVPWCRSCPIGAASACSGEFEKIEIKGNQRSSGCTGRKLLSSYVAIE